MRCFFEATRGSWSPATGVAWPPCVCVVVVATMRQPARGPDPVVSLCQVECGVATALRRGVPHSSGPFGVMLSVFSRVPVDARSWRKFGDFMLVSLLVGVVFRLVPASAVGWSGAAGLRTQSNRSVMVVLSLYYPC